MNTVHRTLLIAAILVFPAVSSADTRQLFNGKNLTGWKHVGSGRFVVENGLLHPQGGVGLLWFEGEKVGDAVVRVVYKVKSHKDNSGVFIRIPDPPQDPWMPVDKALEVQINDAGESGYYSTGSVYTFSDVRSRPSKLGEWNVLEITLDGPRTRVHINGVFVSEYTEGDPVPPKKHDWDPNRGPRTNIGYIGVQNHPHGKTVYFKEISIHSINR
jgi:3-keto-disaccharide hydrolase